MLLWTFVCTHNTHTRAHGYVRTYATSSLQTVHLRQKSTKNKKSETPEIPRLELIAVSILQTSCQKSLGLQPQNVIRTFSGRLGPASSIFMRQAGADITPLAGLLWKGAEGSRARARGLHTGWWGERASQSLGRKYEHVFILLQVILLTEVLVFNGQISSYTRIVTDGVLELRLPPAAFR